MSLCLIIDNPDQTAEQFEKVIEHLRAGGPVPAAGSTRSTFEIHTLASTDRAALQHSGGSR